MERLSSCTKYFGLFLCFGFVTICSTQTGEDAVQLHTFLFSSSVYNRRVRPVRNQTLPVQVDFVFTLFSIQELDSAAQKLSVVGVLSVNWRDEYLAWNRTQFGGVTSIMVFQNEIWRPQIFIGAPLDDFTEVGFSSMGIRIAFTGFVTWLPPGVFTFRCTVDIRYYPFDTQNCYLDFATKGYTINELILVSVLKEVNLETFEEHIEWELLSATSQILVNKVGAVQTQVFRNTLTLKRRAAFIVIHSLVPVFLLSVLNVLVFALPAESGEKISLSITLFLAFAIFLTMLSDTLPKNSLTLPIFSMYLILINILSTSYVILTVVVLNIYHKSNEVSVPPFLHSFVMCCHSCRKRTHHCKIEHKDGDVVTDSLSKQDPGTGSYFKTEKISEKFEDQKITWMDVSRTLDVTFAWLFSILLVIATVIFGIILCVGS